MNARISLLSNTQATIRLAHAMPSTFKVLYYGSFSKSVIAVQGIVRSAYRRMVKIPAILWRPPWTALRGYNEAWITFV